MNFCRISITRMMIIALGSIVTTALFGHEGYERPYNANSLYGIWFDLRAEEFTRHLERNAQNVGTRIKKSKELAICFPYLLLARTLDNGPASFSQQLRQLSKEYSQSNINLLEEISGNLSDIVAQGNNVRYVIDHPCRHPHASFLCETRYFQQEAVIEWHRTRCKKEIDRVEKEYIDALERQKALIVPQQDIHHFMKWIVAGYQADQ